jgi:hypothetical protein
MAKPGEEFLPAGEKPGIQAWRIEKMVPTKVDEEMYKKGVAKLFSGDSYIFLRTKKNGAKLDWDIHFWLGLESSLDEMGVAAYKTVELDDLLGGGPTQVREVQGAESPQFKNMFPKGLMYADGGCESGFKKVERDVYKTQLLTIKGKKHIRTKALDLRRDELTNQDVFILDVGLKLYMFTGPKAGPKKKMKALQTIAKIKDDERMGRAEIIHVEFDGDGEPEEFWEPLGGFTKVTNEGMDDVEWEEVENEEVQLLQITDASGTMATVKVNTENGGRISRKLLSSEDTYMLDVGEAIFVWIGRGSNDNERRQGECVLLIERQREETG